MRGYPHETLWEIASRLNVKGAREAALFRAMHVRPPSDWARDYSVGFAAAIGQSSEPLYRGKVFVLVDAHTVSQAEHACLFFEVAAPVTFVGTVTAGSDGPRVAIDLPGNLQVSFTGGEYRHADGRPLSGVGIVPQVVVERSIRGVRAGRDEVLDRALNLARR
jgi:C-terminal processing protease CtpA/Prc